MCERVDDRRQRRRAGNERSGEKHHQKRRLGEESHKHLAARAERSECGTDVHRGERHEDAGERKQADQCYRIGRLRERQVGGKRRYDRGRAAHRAEHDIGRGPKNCRCVLRDDGVLHEQLANGSIREEQRRRRLILQPRAAHVDPTDKQRREGDRDRELEELGQESRDCHRTKKSSASSVRKLYVK